jgi:hypothetical protein
VVSFSSDTIDFFTGGGTTTTGEGAGATEATSDELELLELRPQLAMPITTAKTSETPTPPPMRMSQA